MKTEHPWLFWLLGLGAFLLALNWNGETVVKQRLAYRFVIDASKVHVVEKRPHDCDFLTAPLGSKHCHYELEGNADWFKASPGAPGRAIVYGTLQPTPPETCATEQLDFAHRCYDLGDVPPDLHPTPEWRPQYVEAHWRKVED